MRNEKGQFVKGCKRTDILGASNPNWNGGRPKCLDCAKPLFTGSKYCINHRFVGERNPRWKGGDTKKLKAFAERQRNLRKKGKGSFTFEQWQSLKEKYQFMCLCCKRAEPEIKLTQDHIIPLIKGGRNEITNIQPLCRECNRRKWVSKIDYISGFYHVSPINV